MYKNILVAAEFDDIGLYAIKEAVEFSKLNQSLLSVMHVIEPSPSHFYNNFQEEGGDEEAMIEEVRKEKVALMREHNIFVEHLSIKRGILKAEVLSFIKENNVDLLVVGSHGKKGLELMLGSKANKLVQSVPCNVFIVRKEE